MTCPLIKKIKKMYFYPYKHKASDRSSPIGLEEHRVIKPKIVLSILINDQRPPCMLMAPGSGRSKRCKVAKDAKLYKVLWSCYIGMHPHVKAWSPDAKRSKLGD